MQVEFQTRVATGRSQEPGSTAQSERGASISSRQACLKPSQSRHRDSNRNNVLWCGSKVELLLAPAFVESRTLAGKATKVSELQLTRRRSRVNKACYLFLSTTKHGSCPSKLGPCICTLHQWLKPSLCADNANGPPIIVHGLTDFNKGLIA